MSHGYTVINGYGIELCRITTESLDLGLDNLSCLVQMGMSWNELCKGVGYRHDRLAEHLALHAICNPQCTRSCHTASLGALRTS